MAGKEIQSGITIQELSHKQIADPRDTGRILGRPVTIGESFKPDATNFSGWEITPFSFPNQTDTELMDGCLFDVSAGTTTPIGLVGEPPKSEGEPVEPRFTEFAIHGSGHLLVATRKENIYVAHVSKSVPRSFSYGSGTKIAYAASSEGLTGINIGTPPGIPEEPLSLSDERIPQAMQELYSRLQNKK